MIRFLEISNHTLFWYYLATNLAYLGMLIIALKTSARQQRRLESHRLSWFKETPMTPPITIIAPAHNEEGSIGVAIRNLLELDYPELELLVEGKTWPGKLPPKEEEAPENLSLMRRTSRRIHAIWRIRTIRSCHKDRLTR